MKSLFEDLVLRQADKNDDLAVNVQKLKQSMRPTTKTTPKLASIVARATKFGADPSPGTVKIAPDQDLRAYIVQLDKKITKKLEDSLAELETRLRGGVEDIN